MDLAVDSEGHVLVLESEGKTATYYTPSAYPPTAATTYARHEPKLPVEESFPKEGLGFYPRLRAIAVNPGPGAGKDHLFVATGEEIHEFDSIVKGSGLLNGKFAEGLLNTINIESIAVDGRSGDLYVAHSGFPIHLVNAAGTEVLARINTAGGPKGTPTSTPGSPSTSPTGTCSSTTVPPPPPASTMLPALSSPNSATSPKG